MSLAESFLADLMDSDDESNATQIKSESGAIPSNIKDEHVTISSSNTKSTDASSYVAPPISSPLLESEDLHATIGILEELIADDERERAAEEARKIRESDQLIGKAFSDMSRKRQRAMSDGEEEEEESDSDSDSDVDNDDVQESLGDLDAEGEQALLDAAARLAGDIQGEVARLHRLLQAEYSARLPQLAEIVGGAVDYVRVVDVLSQQLDARRRDQLLQAFLPNAVVLTINVTAAAAADRTLPPQQQARVSRLCELVLRLHAHAETIEAYTRSRVRRIAPNLAALVGAEVAAALLSAAGGLRNLIKMPACNLLVAGARKHALVGLSTAVRGLHEGLVYGAPVLADAAAEHRKKMARMVANKAALALRVDARRQAPDGSEGRALLLKVNGRLEQLQEPAQNRVVKALPRPDEQKKKRRGGRVARLRRTRTAQTGLAKLKNRVMFGQAELADDITGEGLGLIGQHGTGVMRVKADDSHTLKDALGKRLRGRIAGTMADKTDLLGAATERAPPPAELAPSFAPARPARNKDTDKQDYFSSSAGFRGVARGKDA